MNIIGNKTVRNVLIFLFAAIFIVSTAALMKEGIESRQSSLDGDVAKSDGNIPDPNDYRRGPTEVIIPNASNDTDDGADTSEPEGTLPPEGTSAPDETKSPDETSTPDTEPAAPVYDPYADALRGSISISGLKSKNSDVIGWLYIGGARASEVNVNEPIIHYSDNDYYLRRTWLGKKASDGCIFMETKSSPSLDDFNTIIYGHRLKSGRMFGKLGDFAEKKNWERDPYVYIYTEDSMYRYIVFAVYRVDVDGMTYQIGFSGAESKQEFIDFARSQSMYDTGVVPTVNDRILTLSTCTGDTGEDKYKQRFIVQALLVDVTPRQDVAAGA